MVRTVTAGLDGSRESRAAAEWAAREAGLLGLPLRLVHVWEPVPEPIAQAPLLGAETQQHWTERVPREAAEGIRLRHPGLDVSIGQLSGRPADELLGAAKDAELLVLGSRGLSGIGGFMVGSVGLSVVAHAERPVVLVRADQQAADEHETDPVGIPSAATPFRPVVVGLDTDSPDEELIAFAFAAAVRRGTCLRVVHGWNPPPTTPTAWPWTSNSTMHWPGARAPTSPRSWPRGAGSSRTSRSPRSRPTAPRATTSSTPPARPPWSWSGAESAAARSAPTSGPSPTPSCTTPSPPSPSYRTTDP